MGSLVARLKQAEQTRSDSALVSIYQAALASRTAAGGSTPALQSSFLEQALPAGDLLCLLTGHLSAPSLQL